MTTPLMIFLVVLALGDLPRSQLTTTQSPAAPAASVSRRVGVALVIGNSGYEQAPLPSVDDDKTKMAGALKSMGFEVWQESNLKTPEEFEDAWQRFNKDSNAEVGDILLVYYSGHGLQIDGKPALLGTGVPANDSSASLRRYAQNLDKIISLMEGATPAARVLIVDACRNNVYASTARKAGPSFNRYIEDTYILFADEPGKTVPARTATGVQSPFTTALLFAFENSDGGLEERFAIAQAKTRELNPDQNPQMLRSDTSAGRNLAFLDHGGHSAPLGSAGDLLNDAESFYRSRSWPAFYDKVREARVLSVDAALSNRLDKELSFHALVTAALQAEEAAKKNADDPTPRWADAAQSWQKALAVFPARLWVGERAAAAWLLADRLPEAAAALGSLAAYEAMSKRASEMLASLVSFDPRLDAIANGARKAAQATLGPEFEKYVKGT